jgi:undecaprenyl diphosphate synthase
MKDYRSEIDMKNLPRHVAVIMDGNGRWAKQKGMERIEGHRKGALVVEKLLDAALELKVSCVSLYAFSTENWSRPVSEVKGLWKLLEDYFEEKLPSLKERGVRVVHSGSESRLPASTLRRIQTTVQETAKNKKITLNFCLNYGGRQEIVDAVNRWRADNPNARSITEKDINRNLYTAGLPDVDLLIRTSGEQRLSNFLPWQTAYAEFVFMKVLWPDFNARHLYQAIYEYQNRSRRFGGV